MSTSDLNDERLTEWERQANDEGASTLSRRILVLIAEVRTLRRWKEEALPVIGGLQELGRALDLPLGKTITGPAALAAVRTLRAKVEAAEAEVKHWVNQIGFAYPEQALDRIKVLRAKVEAAEAERDQLEARLKTAVYNNAVHRGNYERAALERDDARILRKAAEAERDVNHRHMRAEAKDHGETKRLLKKAEARVAELESERDLHGWQHGWSERTLAAEAEVQRLRNQLDGLVTTLERGEHVTYEAITRGRALLASQVQDKPDVSMSLSNGQDKPEAGEPYCPCGVVDDLGDGTCGNCGLRIMTDDDEAPQAQDKPEALRSGGMVGTMRDPYTGLPVVVQDKPECGDWPAPCNHDPAHDSTRKDNADEDC